MSYCSLASNVSQCSPSTPHSSHGLITHCGGITTNAQSENCQPVFQPELSLMPVLHCSTTCFLPSSPIVVATSSLLAVRAAMHHLHRACLFS